MFRVNYSNPASMPTALSGLLSRTGVHCNSNIIDDAQILRETDHKPMTAFGAAPSRTPSLIKRRRRLRRNADQRH